MDWGVNKEGTEGPERISAVAEVGAGLEREEGKQVEIWRGMSWDRTKNRGGMGALRGGEPSGWTMKADGKGLRIKDKDKYQRKTVQWVEHLPCMQMTPASIPGIKFEPLSPARNDP